jgi:hypothetical protein
MTDNTPNPEPVNNPAPDPTPAPEPSPREAFINSLPDEFKQDPIFANFDDWGGVAKSYANAAKLVGMDKNQILALPKESTPEAMAPIWDKLGRPADTKGYDIEQYKEVLPPEVLGKYADIAHKNGVSKAAFNSMIGEFVNESVSGQKMMAEQQEQQIGQWQQEVKKELGAAYDEKMNFARKAVETFGLTEVVQQNMAVFENPALVKALITIGEKTSEGMVLANGSVTHGKLAPAEAKMELAKFTSDSENVKIMMDKSHPQHEFIMNKRSELFKYAFPE